jgi:transposase-like protein
VEGVAVSEVCQKHGISVTNFHNWQKILFEGAEELFVRKPNSANVRRQEAVAEKKVAALEAKLEQKNEVIAELLQEHVQLKKVNGGPWVDAGSRVTTGSLTTKNRPSLSSTTSILLKAIVASRG